MLVARQLRADDVSPPCYLLACEGLDEKLVKLTLNSEVMKKLNESRQRIGVLGVGLLANQLIDWLFNFLLYPVAIYTLGLHVGFCVMLLASVLLCYWLIIFYDWSKQDWLGIETIKSFKEYSGSSSVWRFLSKIMQRSDSLAVLILSVKFDPFVTVLYMRETKRTFGGMDKRDWKIFALSSLIGNVYWSLVVFSGIDLAETVLELLKKSTN